MDFRILGPLEVSSGSETLDLGGPKQRALLALLVLEANWVVSQNRLIDALWDGELPATAAKALHVYISQLRKPLGQERILTKSSGYLLQLEPEEPDFDRFKRLQDEGRYDEALALWRGPPLDLDDHRFAQPDIIRLEEPGSVRFESRIERDLERGCTSSLVPVSR